MAGFGARDRAGPPGRFGQVSNAHAELRGADASGRPARWLAMIRENFPAALTAVMLGVGVFVIPFLAYATNVLHVFYVTGSSFYDAGWSAYLIHDADFEIHNPLFADNGISWFDQHISPLFILTSAIGHLVPLTRIQFYAAYIGISHALPGVAVFWLLVSGYRMTTPMRCGAAAFLALLFSFDGLALAIAQFPHFTMFIVGTGMMFLVALVLRHYAIATFFFLLCLATREDAGFHLFALLSLAFLLEWWRGTPWREQKRIAVFAACAFVYSTAVMAVQHALAGGHSLLNSEYLGNPPFAHLTVSLMVARFLGWMVFRHYFIVPAMVAIAWAIVRRNPYIALGYAAFVPWGLIHLAAARDLLGILPFYYAYPYMFASFWPLIGLLIEQRHTGRTRSLLEPVGGFALMTAASFVPSPYQHNPTNINLPADFFSPPSLARQTATDRALTLLAGAPQLGTQIVDQSVLALVPDRYRAGSLLSATPHARPDSVVYFAHGFSLARARKAAAEAGLEREYAVPGTSIRVASNRALEGVDGLRERRSSTPAARAP